MNASHSSAPLPATAVPEIAPRETRGAAPPRGGRWRAWLKLGVFVAVLAALAAGVYAFGPGMLRWTVSLPAVRDAIAAAEKAGEGEHSEGDGHDHGAPAAGNPNVLELSPQAAKNIGLKTAAVTLGSFEKTIAVPAIIVERPGRSVIEVSAPLTGIVTRVYPIQGEALAPGQPLFELRMTHEELVQAQSDYLQGLEQLDVVGREIARLEKLAESGAIAGKTLLERKYEEQKLEAGLHSQRQALMLHGLSEAQVDEIAGTRMLVQGMPVVVPQVEEAGEAGRLLQVQELKVEQGQHVEAGDTLCVLVDHALLYIQGQAFADDAEALSRAAEAGWKLTLVPAGGSAEDAVGDLEVLYVADQVDADSRALHFYVRLPNTLANDKSDGEHRFVGWRFKPGQRVELRLPVERWEKKIVLPAAAVVREGPDAYVFQQTGKTFTRRPIHVEYADPLWAVVANDGSLYPGDVVALTGAEQMQIAIKNRSGGAIDPHAGHNH